MNSPKFRQVGIVAIGELLGTAAMIGVFALIGKFTLPVLWGGIIGGLLAIANFFFLCLFANIAADKAERQDVAGGQKLVQLSYIGRMIAMILVLILCAKSGIGHPLALAIPLVFERPILMIDERIRRKGENKA